MKNCCIQLTYALKFWRRAAVQHWQTVVGILVTLLVLETTLGNIGFWKTIAYTPVPAHEITVTTRGMRTSGDRVQSVMQTSSAGWTITNIHQAVHTVGLSELDQSVQQSKGVQRDESAQQSKSAQQSQSAKSHPVQYIVHIRIDAQDTDNRWHTGHTQLVDLRKSQASVLPQRAVDGDVQALAVHIVEPQSTSIPTLRVTINTPVPWNLSWMRLGLGVLIIGMVLVFRPRSKAWRISFSQSQVARTTLWFLMLLGTVITAAVACGTAWWSNDQSFHEPNSYTYDFNQYAHLAQSLLAGHVWLDLPVPHALTQLSNPYDPAARATLLANDTYPIYWDHAYFQGRWYSYFGIVPAILFFVPFQWVTSWFIPGGIALPSSIVTAICLLGFLLGLSAVLLRIVDSYAPHTTVATTLLCIISTAIACGAWYISQRGTFYEVALATGLMLIMWGLWFWLGTTRYDSEHRPCSVSLPHMVAGCMCMAATLGCRVPMIAAAALWFVLFAPACRAGLIFSPVCRILIPERFAIGNWKRATRSTHFWSTWRIDSAILVSVVTVFAPMLYYNYARFGSIFDFGNKYQITVTDMVHRTTASASLWQMLRYYLFTPARFIPQFPWVGSAHTPIEPWQYGETMVAGLCWIAPAILLPWCLPILWRTLFRSARREQEVSSLEFVQARSLLIFTTALWLLGSIEFVAVTWAAGLDWRYITDFAWYWLLAACIVLIVAERWSKQRGYRALRMLAIVVMLVSLVLSFLLPLVGGQTMSLSKERPDLYMQCYAWALWW